MKPQDNQISRYGAYGIVVHGSTILLTLKRSGPYKGLWDLPGGAIEFGESPEVALKRELLEEAALTSSNFELLRVATANTKYHSHSKHLEFHHVGILYKVLSPTIVSTLVPEEECNWMTIPGINSSELTPFAKLAIQELVS